MNVDLNVNRNVLDVQLESVDEISAKSFQRQLNTSGITFKTLDWRGRWQIPATFIVDFAETFKHINSSWTTRASERLNLLREEEDLIRIERDMFSTRDHKLSFDTRLTTQPYEEQLEAARLMSAPSVRRFALFWKPGTGKTGAMITAAHELLSKGVVNGVLVVAERPVAIGDPWCRQLNEWLPGGSTSNAVVPITGSKSERLKRYHSNPDWIVIHYGILDSDQYAIRSWADRKSGVERPVIIFDESDLIKNPQAIRSRAAMTVRQDFGRCWIASGTPAPNHPSDYEHQISVLAGYPVDLHLTGERSEDAPIVIHALERGVYYLQRENPRKMPEMTTPVYVDLSPPQRKEYDNLANDLILDLESMDDAHYRRNVANIMSRRLQLLRLCSDPSFDALPNPVFDEPAKWAKIDSLLETILVGDSEKAVIWTRFRATAEALWRRFSSTYGASLMMGGSEGSPTDLLRTDCRLLIATMQVGSSSIDLTAARNAIYESLDDVSRNYVQSMARINRTGQTKDCRYWVVLAKNTVEEDQFENIMAKMSISEDVLDEIGRPGRSHLIEMLKRTIVR